MELWRKQCLWWVQYTDREIRFIHGISMSIHVSFCHFLNYVFHVIKGIKHCLVQGRRPKRNPARLWFLQCTGTHFYPFDNRVWSSLIVISLSVIICFMLSPSVVAFDRVAVRRYQAKQIWWYIMLSFNHLQDSTLTVAWCSHTGAVFC